MRSAITSTALLLLACSSANGAVAPPRPTPAPSADAPPPAPPPVSGSVRPTPSALPEEAPPPPPAEAEVRALLVEIVPEIARGDVQIRAIARDPGRRTKVIVSTTHPEIDPIAAVVGDAGGDRARRLVEALHGEPVDYLPWADEPARLITYAVAPVPVLHLVFDEQTGAAAVVVADADVERLVESHLALAARLTGRALVAMPSSRYEAEGADDWHDLPTASPHPPPGE